MLFKNFWCTSTVVSTVVRIHFGYQSLVDKIRYLLFGSCISKRSREQRKGKFFQWHTLILYCMYNTSPLYCYSSVDYDWGLLLSRAKINYHNFVYVFALRKTEQNKSIVWILWYRYLCFFFVCGCRRSKSDSCQGLTRNRTERETRMIRSLGKRSCVSLLSSHTRRVSK